MLLVEVVAVALPAPEFMFDAAPVEGAGAVVAAFVVPVALLAPRLSVDVVTPVVSELVLLVPYWSELLCVPLLQPATPKAREAIAAATTNVILFVFIG